MPCIQLGRQLRPNCGTMSGFEPTEGFQLLLLFPCGATPSELTGAVVVPPGEVRFGGSRTPGGKAGDGTESNRAFTNNKTVSTLLKAADSGSNETGSVGILAKAWRDDQSKQRDFAISRSRMSEMQGAIPVS
jgi:hypothetical protein